MCKYCNTGKEHQIVSYDNTDAMNVSYGQYQGVNVYGSLSMKGDMLMLSGSGSYRSHSDCYYEDNGVECDNECSQESKPAYVQIKFCPFCGKRLESHEYEKMKLKDDIERKKTAVESIKNELNDVAVLVDFSFETTSKNYRKAEKIIWPNDKSTDVKLETIINEFGNLKATVEYKQERDDYMFKSHGQAPVLDFNNGIRFHGSYSGTFCSYTYQLDRKAYERLVGMKLIKKDESEFKKVNDIRKKIQDRIVKIDKEIKELKTKLKTL